MLVLSEFTGAAAVLKDALLTNPHDPRDLQDRLLQALAMEPQEIRWRLRGLHETLQQHTLERWGQDFLGALHDEGPARPG